MPMLPQYQSSTVSENRRLLLSCGGNYQGSLILPELAVAFDQKPDSRSHEDDAPSHLRMIASQGFARDRLARRRQDQPAAEGSGSGVQAILMRDAMTMCVFGQDARDEITAGAGQASESSLPEETPPQQPAVRGMETTMRIKWFGLAAAVLFLVSIAQSSFADTLKLTGTSGGSVNIGGGTSVNIYPYNFSVDGSSSTTELMCLSFNREVTDGEQWSVNIDTIAEAAGKSSTLLKEYEEDAWLYSQITPTTSATEDALIQFAVWDILDPSGVQTNSDSEWKYNKNAIENLIYEASNGVKDADPGFFDQFQIYIPAGNSSDYTSRHGYPDGVPQIFLGMTPAPPPPPTSPTPEPASLLLLGTSLIGTVGALKRKLRRTQA